MKTVKLLLTALILMIGTIKLAASGNVAIYAMIEKVVLEPNDQVPERIQIWGAFTLADGGNSAATLTPQRGYLYLSLPAFPRNYPDVQSALKEWSDLKAVAGTGQAVAFGGLSYIGAFSDELISRPAGMPPYLLVPGRGQPSKSKNIVRTESTVPPSEPDPYPFVGNIGVNKLAATGNLAAVVERLKAALKR